MKRQAGISIFLSLMALSRAYARPIYEFENTTITNGVIFDTSGNLFGTASSGQTNFLFELSPPKTGSYWNETTLFTFPTASNALISQLVFDKTGNLYGMSSTGGASNNGFAFELSPPGAGQTQWTETILHSFSGGSDGADPQGGLVFDGSGNLYGTTMNGGATNLGTVFQLTPPAAGQSQWAENILYNFQGGTDGANPTSAVTLGPNGVIFGATLYGGEFRGVVKNHGIAFKLTPPQNGQTNWVETNIFTYTGGAGYGLKSQFIIDSQSNLYGTTQVGGWVNRNDGTVIELSPKTTGKIWTYTTLGLYNAAKAPIGGLAFDQQGNIYGTTSLVLSILFKETKITNSAGSTTWKLSLIHGFSDASTGAVVFDAAGNVYGTLTSGAVFKITP